MTNRAGAGPRVTVHYAQTLDGQIATRTGHARWISGDASLHLAHQLRAEHQALMVGVGTAVTDNPQMTVRLVKGPSPLRIVLDSTLRLPLGATILSDGAAPTLIATTERAAAERIRAIERPGVSVLRLRQDAIGQVDLVDLLHHLATMGIESLLIEGGGAVITSVLRQRLVDRLIVCIAPKLVGSGIAAVNDLDIHQMSDALTFCQGGFRPLGEDIIFEGRFERDRSLNPISLPNTAQQPPRAVTIE